MKKYFIALLLMVSPMLIFAMGIPDENKRMILIVTVVGIIIVLLALSIVSISVAIMSKTIHASENKDSKKVKKIKEAIMSDDDDRTIAIALALHLEKISLDEEEKAILTIQKVIKPFSGWNNKAFGMRNPKLS
ncbi:MAG: OadG family transporter subunit [Candidatus Marinimicrobia bacterium]|nr:OadG family transporter subunit [Candidatus Neomarinimicrobiota bacterium]